MDLYKKNYTSNKKVNGEPYDYRGDFKILSTREKQEILKTAKNLLRKQRENEAFLDHADSTNEAGMKII